MLKNLISISLGFLFGLGLAISEMINPQKIINFLDVFGNWDPSLLLVLASATTTTLISFRYILKREKPVLSDHFETPKRNKLGASLILGAIIFGIGWGLVGLCPGPAIASLSYFRWESIVFLLAMVAGLYMDRFYYSMFAGR